jgi:hypothetical protein
VVQQLSTLYEALDLIPNTEMTKSKTKKQKKILIILPG